MFISDLLETIAQKKQELDAARPFPVEMLNRIKQWYDVELTYTSNALEGNTLTRSETAIVIEKGLTVRGKPLIDHMEAIDHYEALQFLHILVADTRPLTEVDVRDIHSLVVARTQSREAGRYSSYQRFISGSPVVLPSPEKIRPLMSEFGHWLIQVEPKPENAIRAHFDLVSIHPFSDGNGRTSRLLMNLLLLRGGYPPMVIHPENKPDYIDSLERAQMYGDKSDYQVFMLQRLDDSLSHYLDFICGVTRTHHPHHTPNY